MPALAGEHAREHQASEDHRARQIEVQHRADLVLAEVVGLSLGSPPALLISTSTRPSSRSTVATISRRSCAEVTSAVIARTWPPDSRSSLAVASSSVSLHATSATRTPRSASAAAMCGPIPRDAPVTIAVRLLSSNFDMCLLLREELLDLRYIL